jgi:lysophospholipase L1-like esterase
MQMPKSFVASLVAITFSISSAMAPDLSEAFFNNPKTVILFLGDSITNNGGYINALQAALLKKFPKLAAKFINVGKSGEAMPGLMKRVDSLLLSNKPNLVFSMYGMNDGGYNPLDANRLRAYHDSIATIVAKVTKLGAPIILMTPTAFDSLTALPLILDAPPYSFKKFYRNYDSVLTAYGNSVKTFQSPTQMVIDMQTPLRIWAKTQRVKTPNFAWTAEGVHPNAAGHQVMADAIYTALMTSTVFIAQDQTPRVGRLIARSENFGMGQFFSLNGVRHAPKSRFHWNEH